MLTEQAYPKRGDPLVQSRTERELHPLWLLVGAAAIATAVGTAGLLTAAHGPMLLADAWFFLARLGA